MPIITRDSGELSPELQKLIKEAKAKVDADFAADEKEGEDKNNNLTHEKSEAPLQSENTKQ